MQGVDICEQLDSHCKRGSMRKSQVKAVLGLSIQGIGSQVIFKTIFYQILLSGTMRNLHLFQTIHKNINIGFI